LIHLLLLAALTAVAFAAGRLLLSTEAKAYLPAIAVQSGEIVWIGAAALLAGAPPLALVDLFVLVLGVAWLALQPELRAVLFLTVFQGVMLAVNGWELADAGFDVVEHQALAVHAVWRVIALGLMWQAYFTSPSRPASAS